MTPVALCKNSLHPKKGPIALQALCCGKGGGLATFWGGWAVCTPVTVGPFLDDRQITHLICVRLKYLLYDFLGGVLGLLPVVFLIQQGPNHP